MYTAIATPTRRVSLSEKSRTQALSSPCNKAQSRVILPVIRKLDAHSRLLQSRVLLREGLRRIFKSRHSRLGVGLVMAGEALIIARFRPLSDFYFPFVWVGYILFLDGAVLAQRGRSLLGESRRMFILLFPVSCAFWWLFELFNQAVHNWVYLGAGAWTGLWYVVIASMDFSTVLPAVWITALAVDCLL